MRHIWRSLKKRRNAYGRFCEFGLEMFRHLKKRTKTPAIKNGKITTDECAVLLKMEDGIKEKYLFLIPYPNLQKNRLVNEIFERKKEEEKSISIPIKQ